LPSTKILPVAVSNVVGKMNFFIEELGGFTNSLVREFTETTNSSLSSSQRKAAQNLKNIEVDVTTIDAIFNDLGCGPDFIKIDVEGAELNVLQGAIKTLSNVGSLMVEITRSHKEVYELMYELEFKAISKSGEALSKEEYPGGNVFFVR
jgi:FkbM family methyltransferase